jgi:hypothetical protein
MSSSQVIASKAGVKEISIDTEGRTPENVADAILGIASHPIA